MSQQDYIEERYGDGECGPFAQALHQLTGWPIVLLRLREAHDGMPVDFPRHAVVEREPDRFVDAHGETTLEAVEERFCVRLWLDPKPRENVYPLSAAPGEDLHYPEEFAETLVHAQQLLDIHELTKALAP